MLLLRNPISNTKRFFQKTLNGFKSFFSGGGGGGVGASDHYQRIPKMATPSSPPLMNFKTTYDRLEREKAFANQWEPPSVSSKKKRWSKKNSDASPPPLKFSAKQGSRDHVIIRSSAAAASEKKRCLVGEMLRELELMTTTTMDTSNVDHVLDIEEFLHYYSRLTCPAYVDIVDDFFMEMYAEFFGHQSATHHHHHHSARRTRSSRPKLRS